MNQKEIEQLDKKSIYTLKINNDLKDQVIQGHLNELNRVIKTNIKKKDLAVIVVEKH